MMRHDQFVETRDFLRTNQPHGQMFQNLLLSGAGPTMPDWLLFHGQQPKKLKSGLSSRIDQYVSSQRLTTMDERALGASGSLPFSLVNVNGTLFFSANDGVNGFELW